MNYLDKNDHHYTLVQLTEKAIPEIVKLSAIIGWDYTIADLKTIFNSGVVYGLQTEDGQLVSTAAIFPYDNRLASIGMVIVHSHHRGKQLGKRITQACLDRFANIPVLLVATQEGIPLYEKMGFKSVGTLHKLIASSTIMDLESDCIQNKTMPFRYRNINKRDLEEIIKLDAAAVGATRECFLTSRINQAKQGVVVTDPSGRINGFGLSIELPEMLLVGPIVAASTYQAEALIGHLIGEYRGMARIDVPSEHRQLIQALGRYGFKTVNQPPIMAYNTVQLPQRDNTLFAIAAQAFG